MEPPQPVDRRRVRRRGRAAGWNAAVLAWLILTLACSAPSGLPTRIGFVPAEARQWRIMRELNSSPFGIGLHRRELSCVCRGGAVPAWRMAFGVAVLVFNTVEQEYAAKRPPQVGADRPLGQPVSLLSLCSAGTGRCGLRNRMIVLLAADVHEHGHFTAKTCPHASAPD